MNRNAIKLALILAFALTLPLAADECTAPKSDDSRYHVMVANDDGADAPGIAALVTALAADPAYRVTVVAPATQQSAKGHSLVIKGEVEVRSMPEIAGCTTWAVNATPATTVRIGLGSILVDDPPDLVLSGINRGENVGRIAWYSGTVGAAREAALYGISSVALSLQLNWEAPDPDWQSAAKWGKKVVDAVRTHGLPDGVYLNVNIPLAPSEARGVRLARMGLEKDQLNRYLKVREEDGVHYYKAQWYPPREFDAGTDNKALSEQWVTIVPLGLDATNYLVSAEVGELSCFGPAPMP